MTLLPSAIVFCRTLFQKACQKIFVFVVSYDIQRIGDCIIKVSKSEQKP